MTDPRQPLTRLARRRLEGLTALREANQAMPAAVARARASGLSMETIAAQLGMTRQGVYKRLGARLDEPGK